MFVVHLISDTNMQRYPSNMQRYQSIPQHATLSVNSPTFNVISQFPNMQRDQSILKHATLSVKHATDNNSKAQLKF